MTQNEVGILFQSAPFMAALGAEVTAIGEGWVESLVEIRPNFHHQQNGFIHAGVQATLADHTAGAAAATLVSNDIHVLTVEFKINLLRPAIGTHLTCRAEVLKPGRTLTIVESSVHAWQNKQSKLVSKATVTIANVPVNRV